MILGQPIPAETWNDRRFAAVIVQKCGGTSVGSVDRIHAVAVRAAQTAVQGHQVEFVGAVLLGAQSRLGQIIACSQYL